MNLFLCVCVWGCAVNNSNLSFCKLIVFMYRIQVNCQVGRLHDCMIECDHQGRHTEKSTNDRQVWKTDSNHAGRVATSSISTYRSWFESYSALCNTNAHRKTACICTEKNTTFQLIIVNWNPNWFKIHTFAHVLRHRNKVPNIYWGLIIWLSSTANTCNDTGIRVF